VLLFVVIIFVTLYHNLAFIHKNAISISNSPPHPPAPSSAFVKELSVNDNMSKNNDVTHIRASPLLLPSAEIKTHNAKTTLSQQPSKSNISNQQVSLPIINNHNIHNYTHTVTNSSNQNTKTFSLSQQSSIGKSVSENNLTTRVALRSLPISNNNNSTSNIHTNSHLVIVPPFSKITNTSTNNSVHKTVINTHLPVSNEDSAKIYELSKTSIKKLQLQQQQEEQELKSKTSSDFDPLPMGVIITANAGQDQKIKEGKKVTLHGAGSDSGSSSNTDQLNFLWNQISGKSVKLHHIDTAKAKFKAPNVKKTTKLGFQLTVYDGNGNSSSDTVKIIVKSHKHTHSHKHKH
jgi:hypothetical protein